MKVCSQSIIFQVITKNYNVMNADTRKATSKALRSPETKQHKRVYKKKRKRQEEKVTLTCAILVQIQVHIINNNDKSSIHPGC